jgi:antitoxin (DNA-binding transcriptional repressor) of toxin-antitoxin stability system
MTTRFIGVKELRQNMAKVSISAQKKQERVIVLRKNKPIFELRPLSTKDTFIESFRRDIEEGQADARAGRTHTQASIEKMLGL